MKFSKLKQIKMLSYFISLNFFLLPSETEILKRKFKSKYVILMSLKYV